MKTTTTQSWRRFFSSTVIPAPAPIPRTTLRYLPIPYRSLPDPVGQDQDYITVAHSHLIHADWSKLESMAAGLNDLRTKHIFLRIQRDPVLSFKFFDWIGKHRPPLVNLEISVIILHILTRYKRFRSSQSLINRFLMPDEKKKKKKNVKESVCSMIFYEVLNSYRLCESSPNVFDCLFKTYAHMKKFGAATEVFGLMKDYGFFPTVESCNAFLSSMLQFERADIMLSFYREMVRSRISPNSYTINMIMSGLCRSGNLDKAMRFFEQMEMLGFSNTASLNILIAGNCKKGLMEHAMTLKNSMIRKKGLHPNTITYNTIIHGFCKQGRMNEANKIFNEMNGPVIGVKPTTVTYNILIDGYSRKGDTEMTCRLHEEMLMNDIKPDIITYNGLIWGFCNLGKMRKAAVLLKDLNDHDLQPNASTFDALLTGQCKRQNSEKGFQIYKAMKICGHYPNQNACNLLISTFCKNGDFEGAVEIVKELMLERWMIPEKTTLVNMFRNIYKTGKNHLVSRLELELLGRQKMIADCITAGQILAKQSSILKEEQRKSDEA